MNDLELNLYLKYPALHRANKQKTEFRGIIEHGVGKSTFVTFHVPNYPSAKNVSFETRNRFSEEEKRLLQSEAITLNFFEYLELFKRLLSDRANVEAFNEKRFQTFCNEFVSLKTLYPKQKYILDKDIGHVKIIHRDENYVEYFVKVKIDFYHKYGSLYEISEHSFPEVKNKELFSDEKSIKYIHKKFMNYAESLKSFYDIIGRIDTICWILDPPNATSKHVQRRIVIEEGVSMQVTFDPWNATARPDMKFFGPSRLCDKFLKNVAENAEDWDPDYDIVQNILKLIDLPFFPVKTEENNEECDETGECCMCYQTHLNEKLPEIICENPSCESYFHTECLYQWLSTIPNKKIFNTISAQCPLCEKVISCKIPDSAN